MHVDTRYGTLEIDPDTLLSFPSGLPGFENLTRFTLLHEEGKSTVFWLQSVDDTDVQFSVTNPNNFKVNYQITLQDDEAEMLELTDDSETIVLLILSRDMEAYNHFLNTQILDHPSVHSASSSFALRRVKYTTALPLQE